MIFLLEKVLHSFVAFAYFAVAIFLFGFLPFFPFFSISFSLVVCSYIT